MEASACVDWKAHCHLVIDDPRFERWNGFSMNMKIIISDNPRQAEFPKEAIEIDRYLFPCSYIHSHFNFQLDHPSNPESQIQAEAVSAGCNWCPYFDPFGYKKIGKRLVYKEAFT